MPEIEFDAEEKDIIAKVLLSDPLASLMGAGEWELTETEEDKLWGVITRLKEQGL